MSVCEPRKNLSLSSDPVKDAALGGLMSWLSQQQKDEVVFNQAELKAQNETLISGNQKQLFLTDELAKLLGAEDTTTFRVVKRQNKIEIYPNIHSLAKVYIEPTTLCNLNCRTCIRKTWHEPLGSMKLEVFDGLLEQLKEFKSLQTVMFGGFGEPTFHKDILYMIGKVKALGLKAEMVTNGTLLNEAMLQGMLDNGLDTLWVSFDGTSEDSFDDIRAGASFIEVVQNLRRLKELNQQTTHKIKVGIAFVVMKRNIKELRKLGTLAQTVGAEMVSVSNVIPYSSDMLDQMVCERILWANSISYYSRSLPINLPFIDRTETTKQTLFELFRDYNNISIMRNHIDTEAGSCRFVKERCTFIKWDGTVSSCMGLLHSYKTYFTTGRAEREVTAYVLGDTRKNSLKEIWDGQEYHDFREKVDEFDFSPCLQCGPCDLAEKNEEDCFGNKFPTCGGCLWAQGVIQCP
ncbi:Antilisterial bacteriocin subtilosin biosynthesis protein AlbA [Pelotomaculum sp. FP]|nr:Antilisterial bacteriocin subtilosin biosynthesis protein AlbA [Pelotomaculum sp. FP]